MTSRGSRSSLLVASFCCMHGRGIRIVNLSYMLVSVCLKSYLTARVRPLLTLHMTRMLSSSTVEVSPTGLIGKGSVKEICDSKDMKLGYTAGKKILEQFAQNRNLKEHSVQKMKGDLSAILYLLYLNNDKTDFWMLFNASVQLNMAKESAFVLALRLYGENGDLQGIRSLHEQMAKVGIPVHVRSTIPLICASIRCGDFLSARAVHGKVKAMEGFVVSADVYNDILEACAEVRKVAPVSEVNSFVEEILNSLHDSAESSSELNSTLKFWFDGGVCLACKKLLKTFHLTPVSRLKLQQSMMALIKASIMESHTQRLFDLKQKSKSKVKDAVKHTVNYMQAYAKISHGSSVDAEHDFGVDDAAFTDSDRNSNAVLLKLKQLKAIIVEHGPFDAVIDALNCGYLRQGFNSGQVSGVL